MLSVSELLHGVTHASVPVFLQLEASHEEVQKRDCWHIRSRSDPNAISIQILNHASTLKPEQIAPLCTACTYCYVPRHIKQRFDDFSCLEPVSQLLELLSEPFATHYLLSKFFYHRTELWKWSAYDALTALKTYRIYRSPPIYAQVANWLRCMAKHLPFFRTDHYQFLVLDTELVSALCSFIHKEMDFEVGPEGLGGHVGFYVLWILCYLRRWCMDCRHSVKSEKSLRNAMEKMQKLTITLQSHSEATYRFAFILKEHRKTASIVEQQTKRLWRKERRREQCQNEKCTKLRKSSRNKRKGSKKHKWMLCSSCFVAGYCCRKCAKFDWNYGHHKLFCKSFAQLKHHSAQNVPDFDKSMTIRRGRHQRSSMTQSVMVGDS